MQTKKSSNISTGIFWYWNATPTLSGIRRQLAEISAAGFSCVYIHPMPEEFHKHVFFTGMTCRYLGKKYFSLLKYTLEECKKLGLYLMLYDEGGWPSGSVLDTLVQKYPECRAKTFVRQENGEITEQFENFPDQFRADPVRRFIEMTHELYKKEFGDEFGKTIRGIFTDEPFLRLSIAYPKTVVNDEIIAGLKKEYGMDFLKDVMPYIGEGRAGTPEGEFARRAYCDIGSKLFAKHYSAQLARWCRENHLDLEGHFSGEDWYVPFGYTGNLLRVLTPFHVPGIDTIWRQIYPGNPYSYFPRFAASAAQRERRSTALCESFNVYTYSLTPKAVNYVANTLLVQGINRILPMPYLYTDAGKHKICCSTDISHRTPIYDAFKEFNRRWNFAGNFNTGALQPRVWVMHGVVYPGAENDPERKQKQESCDQQMRAVADTLDVNCVFWRFADEDDLKIKESPELLIIPFPQALLPAQKKAVEVWKERGVKVVNSVEKADLKKYAELEVTPGNTCRILPCLHSEGKAVLVFNPDDRCCDFSFTSKENYALAGKDICDTVYPLKREGSRYTLPMAPHALRILFSDKTPMPEIDLIRQCLDLKWHVTRTDRMRMTLEKESKFVKEKISAQLPDSGNYCELDKDFSGRIYLESELEHDRNETVYIEFENIDHFAELQVNNADCGMAVSAPFIFKAVLKKGKNKLRLKVSGSAGNEFRRCFTEELEPAGYFNVYAARFKQYSVDDNKCGLSKHVFVYREKENVQ